MFRAENVTQLLLSGLVQQAEELLRSIKGLKKTVNGLLKTKTVDGLLCADVCNSDASYQAISPYMLLYEFDPCVAGSSECQIAYNEYVVNLKVLSTMDELCVIMEDLTALGQRREPLSKAGRLREIHGSYRRQVLRGIYDVRLYDKWDFPAGLLKPVIEVYCEFIEFGDALEHSAAACEHSQELKQRTSEKRVVSAFELTKIF